MPAAHRVRTGRAEAHRFRIGRDKAHRVGMPPYARRCNEPGEGCARQAALRSSYSGFFCMKSAKNAHAGTTFSPSARA